MLVGYQLRNSANVVINQWGGIYGITPSIPSLVILSDGSQVHAPSLGTFSNGDRLVELYIDPPAPVIQPISRRQFFQQAAIGGFITDDEALLAVQVGAIPTAILNVVNTLPSANDQFAAKMVLSGAATFDRSHPLVSAVGASMNLTSSQVDTFFIAASHL